MRLASEDCCVLNSGPGGWPFDTLAAQLSNLLGIDVDEQPRAFNYVLHVEQPQLLDNCRSFVPIESIRLASDKRLLAVVFQRHQVPTPETYLMDTDGEMQEFLRSHADREWCIKFPTACGAFGHRFANETMLLPDNWPRPVIVQEFIRMDRPEVYRTYCAGGHIFGCVARRFAEGTAGSPWVAHAQGARYASCGEPPPEAVAAARRAFVATRLWDAFGCVDLLQKPTGEWVVLEVGTDGWFSNVDREIDDVNLEAEINRRIAAAFWRAAVH